MDKRIEAASRETPDPIRAERNLKGLLAASPAIEGLTDSALADAAMLLAASQFLANYAIKNPAELLDALKDYGAPHSGSYLPMDPVGFTSSAPSREADFMEAIRRYRKNALLRITLRFLCGQSGLPHNVRELSALAEELVGLALGYSEGAVRERFGEPSADGRICLIALGKLGAEELNYSSDVDLMAVYGGGGEDGEGQTSGVLNPAGIRANKISNHEYFCKVVELTSKVLSTNTEEGICFRVDLRLRPDGQKGQIALPLKAYASYYESWGRTWERMALIRARPAAGDAALGAEFIASIEPFLWRGVMDYAEIQEIKALKKKIDSTITRDDIKRGYGGIREVEFFVQTFQLIYGPEHKRLRTHRFMESIEELRALDLIPPKELDLLGESYVFLRRLEHFLQMKDDLQTHSLPQDEGELSVLGRKMGFKSSVDFLPHLKLKRKQVKNMYNSLLGTEEDIHGEALTLFEGDLEDAELMSYLEFRGVSDTARTLSALKGIREATGMHKTRREISTMRKVVPALLEGALASPSPDRAIAGLESFLRPAEIREAHLSGLIEHKELMKGIVMIFGLSSYLSRIFLSSKEYLNLLIEENLIRKTKGRMTEELRRYLDRAGDLQAGLIQYKKVEEVRLGAFFLMDVMEVRDLMRYLSHLAECILEATVREYSEGPGGLAVIALGKLGGREITYGSDLDIIFVSDSAWGPRAAEKVMRTMTAYTERGVLYEVDTRLRPDGIKGALVKNVEGYRNYYLKHAQNWEVQALLRARPVAGDPRLKAAFIDMAREVLAARGPGVRREDIAGMRERIMHELARESEGVDIKLGPGGVEEIEFYLQWLQLSHAGPTTEFLAQSTFAAIKKLHKGGLLGSNDAEALLGAYAYYRRLETFMRLNDERPVVAMDELGALAARFMGHGNAPELFGRLRELRDGVLAALKG